MTTSRRAALGSQALRSPRVRRSRRATFRCNDHRTEGGPWCQSPRCAVLWVYRRSCCWGACSSSPPPRSPRKPRPKRPPGRRKPPPRRTPSSTRSWSPPRSGRRTRRTCRCRSPLWTPRTSRRSPPAAQDVAQFLSARVPSLLLESSFGRAFPRFYIRGLGNTDFDLNASQPVSMVYDDVVLENPILKGMPVLDIERVEVLRGPQGTLFGRNTPAGIVKFESKSPTRETEGYVRRLLRHLRHRRLQGRGRRAADRNPLRPRLGALPDPERLGRQRLHRRGRRPRRLRRPAPTACSSCGSRTSASTPCSTSTAGTSTARRASSAANIIDPGTNDLVAGFEQDTVFYDGQNEQEIEAQGASLTLDYDLGLRHPDLDHRLRDHRARSAAATSTAASAPSSRRPTARASSRSSPRPPTACRTWISSPRRCG